MFLYYKAAKPMYAHSLVINIFSISISAILHHFTCSEIEVTVFVFSIYALTLMKIAISRLDVQIFSIRPVDW